MKNLPEILEVSDYDNLLAKEADALRRKVYFDEVYLRGLIEFTNFCKNDCYYCGLRISNTNLPRYRLSEEEILSCCKTGYELGLRTFVLQGGEDPYFTDDKICSIISSIKGLYKDVAVTLSIGEKKKESYLAYFKAGADRYLLREESANPLHYSKLHPKNLSSEKRKECLKNLKEIGYQVGAGFMVGSPFQGINEILSDIEFLKQLSPDMIGIGPFVSNPETPFAHYPNGSVEMTLKLISILRILFPHALIPATTSLWTLDPSALEKALKCGANVIMPNITPKRVRDNYRLYPGKTNTEKEAAQTVADLKSIISAAGYRAVSSKGDVRRI
ncbi:MAG: [FeFe] hydrogenase H-cluster radical SAM maturase HydE [Bacteroidales bacterium]|nr:[FeFe] hydrogenase H-cluster radical SAM maturase HydE [Bacteroidales bacterium]